MKERNVHGGITPASRFTVGIVAGVVLILTGAACSSNSSTSSAPAPNNSSAAMESTSIGAGSIPDQTAADVPAFPAYYDAHKDILLVTDAFPKSAATTFHANYAPSLSAVKPESQPRWFIFKGTAAPGQIAVLGSEPGEGDYSPLWDTIDVTWKPGVTPVLLTSDDMVDSFAKKGQLTETTTTEVVNATVISVGS